MPKRKACFYARAGQLELFCQMADILASESVESCFITQNSSETEYVRKHSPSNHVYELEGFLRESWDGIVPNREAIEGLRSRYPESNIWGMLYTDRFLVNYPYEDAIRFILGHYLFFETVFGSESPDFFINEAIAIFASYAAFDVGNRMKCSYLGMIIARDDAKNKFFIVHDPFQKNIEMERLYQGNAFSDEERVRAAKYLAEFRSKESTPAYMRKYSKPPRFKAKYLLYPAKYLLLLLSKGNRTPQCYEQYHQAGHQFDPVRQWFRSKIAWRYYSAPDPDDRYYLFPLHFQPEASTLVCAAKYEKQLYAIDNIAKSLPFGTKLYVKEHYAQIGHRDISFYRSLKAYPNVRIIEPYENIHELIKKAEAVIVLTSTTGFEAILHQKKVFILGHVFYDVPANTMRIKDVFDEREKLADTRCRGDDEDIIRFVCSYLSSLKSGCASALFPEYPTRENAGKLAKAFLSEMDLMR